MGSDPSLTPVRPQSDPKAAGLLLPLATGAGVAANATSLISIAWFFTQAGAFVFGSGLAVIPFLYVGLVLPAG